MLHTERGGGGGGGGGGRVGGGGGGGGGGGKEIGMQIYVFTKSTFKYSYNRYANYIRLIKIPVII